MNRYKYLHNGQQMVLTSEPDLLCNWGSVSQSVSQSILSFSPSGTHDQIWL